MSEIEPDDISTIEGQEPLTPPAPKETVVDPNDQTGLRDTIKASMAKVNAEYAEREKAKPLAANDDKTRGPDGKFLPKQAAPEGQQPQKIEKPLEGAQPGADQLKKADAAPGTWKAEAKAEWEKLPPSVKMEIARRESDFSRDNAKYQQQIQQINQAYTPIEQLIGPRRALWRAQFGSEAEAIKQMLNLSDLASQSPTDFLAYFLSQPDVASRVDMQKVFGQQAPGDDVMRHPVVQKLNETVSGLQQQVSGFLSHQQTQQTQSAQTQIAEFATAKGPDGNPLRPHFDAVRENVYRMIPALRSEFPQASVTQIMERAYDIAIRTNEGTATEVKRLDEERIRSELEKRDRANKAQLANKSIPPGAPPTHSAPNGSDPNDLRATIKRNFAKYNNGEAARV